MNTTYISNITPSSGPAYDSNQMQFAYAHKGANTIHKAWRIQSLKNNLPLLRAQREEFLKSINTTWETARQLNKSYEVTLKFLEAQLPPKIWNIYQKSLLPSKDISNQIEKFQKDIDRILGHSVKKSFSGMKGPTIFITIPKGEKKEPKTCVIKKSNLDEIAARRFYAAFSNCFTGTENLGFFVPTSSRYDLTRSEFEAANGNISPVSRDFTNNMQQYLAEIVRSCDLKSDASFEQLLLMQKIPAQNLLDFVFSNYNSLTLAARNKFFERLGRLACLDLATGNCDRLIRWMEGIIVNANLGNVLVEFIASKSTFYLYAIDNGADSQLITDPEYQKLYQDFLIDCLKNPKKLVQMLITAFEEALIEKWQEMDPADQRQVEENLSHIRKDLNEIARENLERGFTAISKLISSKMHSTKWDAFPEGLLLKKYLKNVHPQYLQLIESNFNIFKKYLEIQ